MSKELQAGKKPPGDGGKKPQTGKLPGVGESPAKPAGKVPATKTRLAREAPRATTLKAMPEQEAADGKVRANDKPAAITKPVLKQETAPAAGLSKDQTRLPNMTKPTSTGVGDSGSSSGGAEKAASVLGEYKLLKKLGQGGMGAVYKAEHTRDKRIVAIKVLDKELSKKGDFVQRFQRESRVMSKLDHPHVLRYFEFGQHKDYHYLAIEYVEGGSVEGWLKKLGRLSIGDALHVVLKTAAGLQHAHEKNLIHRDIKPDNILLTKEGVVKVADLGLAKDTDEDISITKTGAGAGTPIYMAPEQARDVKHVDCRVDIYALGVMLYVFLTGQPPFQGTTLIEVITAKEKGKFDPVRRHNADVPPKIDLIVDKMLAKDPKHRYASCAEVIDALMPLRLANAHLSFLVPARGSVSDEKLLPEPASSGKVSSLSPTQLTKKGSAGASKGPGMAAGATKVPGRAIAETNVSEQETVEKDLWYWNMKSPKGKIINKKLTTDQIRMLIKSGGIDADAEFSKTPKSGYRAIASFEEFQSQFRAKNTASRAKAKGSKYDDIYKQLAKDQERRVRWGWLSRMTKGALGSLFGLLWIVIILGVIGLGLYLLFTKVLV